MAYNPYPERMRQVRVFFTGHPAEHAISEGLARLDGERTVAAAAALLDRYFAHHAQGDVRGLRQIAYAFSDKRLAKALVDSTLRDEPLMHAIAKRSYPHPIGFDKLVLHSAGYKLRLHVYWRSPQELATELTHLHRFEMASAPITGELTNHLYEVRYGDDGAHHAYTGYERDAAGVLHKRCIGRAELVPIGTPQTFVPGQSYAQGLEHAHFVETNAETGHTNGDICSTIYIHGPGLRDAAGRTIPILFETQRVPDSTVSEIGQMSMDQLETALRRYSALLDESLRFYDWMFDDKYGRNLSVGLVAGYFLCEAFESTRTIEMWENHRAACVDVLRTREHTLAKLINKKIRIEELSGTDRTTRYFQQLVNKSWEHAAGGQDWLAHYGDLVREFERYLGALLGDYCRNPDLRVLKPIWELDTYRLAGGAHYGHIAAMLEAARVVAPQILAMFRSPELRSTDRGGEGPMTEMDVLVHKELRRILGGHYPDYGFAGEEKEPETTAERRWLVDAIDGTRNFIHGNRNFAVSISCQRKDGERWITTDAVVALPAQGEVYWAERGQGAYHISWDKRETRLRAPGGQLGGGLVDLSIRGYGDRVSRIENGLTAAGATLRATGCASLMLAMISGTGNTGAIITANDYDVAAGLLIAEEAGARTSTRTFVRDGRTFTAYIAGASSAIHDALAAIVDA
ncbi:MAG: inositol monophosphatase [Deltaproteobacteria bacterium]|nr:inositol monophosphatase [Deltaproteobacteria bacterium]